jgi:multidrug efflux pump subunit AcrA (membrane-fusion protein)
MGFGRRQSHLQSSYRGPIHLLLVGRGRGQFDLYGFFRRSPDGQPGAEHDLDHRFDSGIAALEAARSERQLDLKRIKSPVNGVVTARKHAPGEYVYDQTPLISIAELDPLYVELVMSASRYGAIKVDMAAELRLNPPIGGTYSAKVQVVDPMIDAASSTFGVRLILPNPGNAIPAGIRCTVQFLDSHDSE